jgi:uncharacterized protein YciI
MFVINVTYIKPLTEIDRLLAARRDHLALYFDAGKLLACGPKNPREGGMILGNFVDREEAEAFTLTDPFFKEGAARYEIVEFMPNKTSEEMSFLLNLENQS